MGARERLAPMSAYGPKQTSLAALHMSAFRGKADMTIAACPLSWSLLGAKRSRGVAAHMPAYDPLWTSAIAPHISARDQKRTVRPLRKSHLTAGEREADEIKAS